MIRKYSFMALEDIVRTYYRFEQLCFFDRMLGVKFCRKLSITAILENQTKLFSISMNGKQLKHNGISIENKRIKINGIIEGENKRIYAIISNKKTDFICCRLNKLRDFIVCERKIKIEEKLQPKIEINMDTIIFNFCKDTANKLNPTNYFKGDRLWQKKEQ